MATTIPLFPLNTVLFRDGPLKLRIFEARYLDMIGRCLREQSGFGVAMIVEGREVGGSVRTAQIGTSAAIVDFERLADGLLGITAKGGESFRIAGVRQQEDGLNVADVDWLPAEPAVALPATYAPFADALRELLPQLAELYGAVEARYEDAAWVGARLAEILPMPLPARQQCLELRDPIERLAYLRSQLKDA